MSKPGGIGAEKEMTDIATQAANAVKADIEKKLNKTLATYEPIKFSSQVVAGTNFFIKIKIGESEYIHARIYRHFSGSTELNNVEENKSADDAITYF
mmetsp:Transcript_28012/g.31142  ORF Transcript_28012/g.31142 Transcript_28012/m.31142 type:complete len:97 (-) Transcript_28012:77-367(-)|eukprot:CAMPEP_0168517538 /NCGR_PEP_ID=MMETSP0405-20121227/6103_1 /TAXON_ID=498012 /ORGANISM="Trichosphaerium sp, Strain Am-I-7 wt" /LENGTH=96 /DNA_ID=CAMNT_0008537551 /DNA_START=46 /DNA_END=336 /DNA_ORIENTATION=+